MNSVDSLSFGDESAWIWGIIPLIMLFGFVALYQWRQGRIEALRARGPLPDLLDGRTPSTLWARAFLLVLAAALLVTGLTQPRWGTSETEVKSLGVDVAIVVDASKSMKVTDVVPDRFSATRLEIFRLLDGLAGGRAALIPFAGLAFTQTELTSDFAVVKSYLTELRVEDMPRGGTAVGRAIEEALSALAPEVTLGDDEELDDFEVEITPYEGAKHKAIVLFTDGEDHEGDAIAAAEEAARRGVKIYTIGVGTLQGRPVLDINEEGDVVGTVKGPDGTTPLFSTLNSDLLKQIAEISGGQYFHMGAGGLGAGLLKALQTLERAEYDATFEDLGENRYQWALLPALFLLLSETWIGGRRRRKKLLAALGSASQGDAS